MGKAEASVEELVGMIERGELRLPEMQRRYVWKSTQVRDLLDSLYRGYPSGAILVWDTDEPVPQQDFAVAQQTNPFQSTRLLLDGQQRLTSLSAVLRGEPIQVKDRKRPIEILFHLDHPEDPFSSDVDEADDEDLGPDRVADEADASPDELQKRLDRMTFVVGTLKLAQRPEWVKVTEVMQSESDGAFLRAAGVTGFDDPRYEQYSQRLARLRGIRKYIYRLDVLERSLGYEEVTEIFVRVNSLGAKLRSSDLALAQITARWRGALAIFQEFQQRCATDGFDLDLGIHLKGLVAFATGQSRFYSVGNLALERLQKAWGEAVAGMEFALSFLKSNAEITSPAVLSSPFLIVTLAYYGHHRDFELSPDEAADLRRWLLLANAKGRYSRGSSETVLDQDLATIRKGGGVADLVERLRNQVGRLDVVPGELEGRSQRSALFKTMYLAFREAGATDWRSNLLISLNHTGIQHRLQFHHIFPKRVLEASFTKTEINDIANLSFIGGQTNRKILADPPVAYFPGLLESNGTAPFDAQCIPTRPELLEVERYKDFLAERRQWIARRLNEYLGTGEDRGAE